MNLEPHPLALPLTEIAIHCLPARKVIGQSSPLTSFMKPVADSIDHFSNVHIFLSVLWAAAEADSSLISSHSWSLKSLGSVFLDLDEVNAASVGSRRMNVDIDDSVFQRLSHAFCSSLFTLCFCLQLFLINTLLTQDNSFLLRCFPQWGQVGLPRLRCTSSAKPEAKIPVGSATNPSPQN